MTVESQQGSRAAALREEGNQALSVNRLPTAIKLYSEAIELDPTSHLAFGNRALVHLKQKNWEAALEDSEKAVELAPQWTKGYFRKGQALLALGRAHEAIAVFRTGMEVRAEDATQFREKLEEAEAAAFSVTLKEFPVMGRSLVAREGYMPGAVILCEDPLVSWSRRAAQDPRVVGICAEHGVSSDSSAFRILEETKRLTKYQWDVINDLSTPEVSANVPQVLKMVNVARQLAEQAPDIYSNDPYDVARLVLAVKTNSHHCVELDAEGEERPGIFKIASKLAHSCEPNAVYHLSPHTKRVSFTACRAVTAGEVLSFSYRGELDFLAMSTWRRQHELLDKFYFWCGCTRCQQPDYARCFKCDCSEEGARMWSRSYPSPSADIAAEDIPDGWTCDMCHRTFPSASIPVGDERELEERALELAGTGNAVRNRYTDLKTTAERAADVLGTRHWVHGSMCKLLSGYFRTMSTAGGGTVASQLAAAFGVHYLIFVSRARIYSSSPLLPCHFLAQLFAKVSYDDFEKPVYPSPTPHTPTFKQAIAATLRFALPLLCAVYKEDSTVLKARELWEAVCGDEKLPPVPRHPRDASTLLPTPPPIPDLFAQWETEVVKLVQQQQTKG